MDDELNILNPDYCEVLYVPSSHSISSINYSCKVVQSTNNTNCGPFNLASNYTGTCSTIQNCLTGFSNIQGIQQTDSLKIYLSDRTYLSSGNCNLTISKYPSQLWMLAATQISYKPVIDCESKLPFITQTYSNIAITDITMQNAINSCITATSMAPLTIAIFNSNFIGNSGVNGGALQMGYGNSLSVTSSNFYSNRATENGGAIYGMSSFTIFQSNFTINSAKFGGAIYAEDELYLDFSTLNSNNAVYGGAIFAFNLHIQSSTLRSNFGSWGGAAYVSTISSVSCHIYSNTADNGGAIVLDSSTSNNLLLGSKVYGNSAQQYGGAIYVITPTTNSVFNLNHSQIYSNTAQIAGGGVFFNDTQVGYLFNGQIFNNNATTYTNETDIGCDQYSTTNCNFCTIDSCSDCQSMQGICFQPQNTTNNNITLCMISQNICEYGSCQVFNSSSNSSNSNGQFTLDYKCSCSTGYQGDQCDQAIPPSKKPMSSLTKALIISMPIEN
eukprot:gene2493-3085_t